MRITFDLAPRRRVALGERGVAPRALPQKYLGNIEMRAPRRSFMNQVDFNVHGHRRFRLYRGDKVSCLGEYSPNFNVLKLLRAANVVSGAEPRLALKRGNT